MADSSFDPLGMVKAMGQQTDPFSWAQLYAQDAAKGAMLREDLRNRLLIQQMTREERAKEGALDRASREGIAERAQSGAMQRVLETIKAGRFQGGGRGGFDVDLPPGALNEDQYNKQVRRGLIKPEDYVGRIFGSKAWYFKKGGPQPVRRTAPTAVPRGTVTPDEYDEETD